MKARVLLLTLLIGAAVGGYFELQKRGLILEGERWFVDFLVANGREALEQNMPTVSKDVVLVTLEEKYKDELGAWPPNTLDWLLVVKRLATYQPEMLVFVDPLRWEGEATEFLLPLRQSLLPFSSVAMGFELSTQDQPQPSPEISEFMANELPSLPGGELRTRGVPFKSVQRIPDRSIRLAGYLGFSELEGGDTASDEVLFVSSDGAHLVPSLAAQAVTLFRRAPYSTMRLRFGPGARLSLADEFIVPLEQDGKLKLTKAPDVPEVNGLDLMLPDMKDELAKTLQQVLGTGKAVVLATDPVKGMQQAKAIAYGLAMPPLTRVDVKVDWALAGLAALLAYLRMLKQGRFGALFFAIMVISIATGVSLAAFHAKLMWWSPLPAYGVLAVAALFCFLWPYKRRDELVSASPENSAPQDAAATSSHTEKLTSKNADKAASDVTFGKGGDGEEKKTDNAEPNKTTGTEKKKDELDQK